MSMKTEPVTAAKTVDYYLSLNYRIAMYRDEEGDYIAEVEGLPGCVADGRTPATAYENIREAIRSWIESRIEAGLEIYEPDLEQEQYSGRLLLRIPKYLHRRLAKQAKAEAVSLNQYLLSKLAEASAWTGTDHDREGVQSRALRELERAHDITLEVLADTVCWKSPAAEEHSMRVTTYAIAIARIRRMDSDAIRVVARAAFLHDIGLGEVPESILQKPSRLTANERAVIEEHALRGFEILSRVPFLREAAQIVYAHHERYDGSGYPRGLRGSAIPLGARILAIADALDTLTSDKPYGRAESFSKAMSEIAKSAGAQFDPDIVKAFASAPRNIWADLRLEVDKRILVSSPSQSYIDEVCERIAAVS